MKLVDTHCHLDFPELARSLDEILSRAEKAGVDKMVTICTRVRRFDVIRQIAEQHDNVFCSVGTHPHYANDEQDVAAKEIIALASHPKVVAIGEAGLDYHYDNAPRDVQREVFRRHIEVARQTGLPLVIHTREADDDMIAILRQEMQKGMFPALVHCFTSGRRLAETALELGLYISMSGVLTFKNSAQIQEIAKDIPLDRLLVETDAPFLAPVPRRGKTNEPALVVHTAQRLADIKDVSLSELARATTGNFFKLFEKASKQQLCSSAGPAEWA